MYKRSIIVAVMAVMSGVSCAVFAAEVVFNPTVQNADGSYSWTNKSNWVGGVLPGINDVQVYQPSGNMTVKIPSTFSQYLRFAGMKFLSGKTYLTSGYYFYANAVETEIYVAGEASAVCSNMIDNWTSNNSIVKTGGGTFTFRKMGENDKLLKLVDVREGTLASIRNGSIMKAYPIRIRRDAVFYANGYNFFYGGNADVQVDEGGTFRVYGGTGKINVGCLTGAGSVVDESNSYTDLQITPTRDCVFSGTMSAKVQPNIMTGATGRFILGASNVLAQCQMVTGSEWLGFLPGIGTFNFGGVYTGRTSSPLVLADTNGAPVTVSVSMNNDKSAKFATTGPGSVQFRVYDTALTNGLVRNEGSLTALSATLTLGDDSLANGFDFSVPSEIRAASGATVAFRSSVPVTFSGAVTGSGAFKFYPSLTTLANLRTTGGATSTLYGDLTINGGDAVCEYLGFTFGNPNTTLTINGGRLGGVRKAVNDAVEGGPIVPDGFVFGGQQSGSKVVLNGGELWVTGEANFAPQTLEQNGGRLYFEGSSYSPLSSATAANPCVVRFNGGKTILSRRDTAYWNDFTPFSSSDALSLRVGAGGVRFVEEHVYSGAACSEAGSGMAEMFDKILRPLVSDVESGVDGGVSQSSFMSFYYAQPLQIAGPYVAEGGATHIDASHDISSGRYFGAGNTTLRNHRINFADRAAEFSFCPHGAGKKLTVEGTGAFELRKTSSGSPANLTIGDLDIDHGALFLIDPVSFGGANASTVKLASAPATSSSGRVLAPVVAAKDHKTFSFMGYDAEQGFTNLVLAAGTSFTGASASKPFQIGPVSANWLAVAAGTKIKVEALHVEGSATIQLNDNASITIGDGVNPAMLILPSYGIRGTALSSLEFGTSEGVVVCGTPNNGDLKDCVSYLRLPIKSANGLTIVGYPSINVYGTIGVCMNGTNTYSGVTRINSAIVQAENDRCFSSGRVIVGGGRRYGGGVRFVKKDGIWANDFTLAGWGIRKIKWTELGNLNGAMSFWRDGKVTGNVELTDDARLCATNGASGEIAGVISGPGKADIVYSRGVLRFSNSNTYTGGTDLIGSSTLELGRGDSAGTGEILLSGSTLRFVNTEPAVFTNKIVGTGTIEVVGAPVTFAGDEFAALECRTLAAGSTITFPNVAGGDLRYAAVLDGDTLDLDGRDVTFHGIWGSGTISGGTVTVAGEIHPGGEGAIGTLTFDRPPVVSAGAKLVAECSGSAVDSLTVAGGDLAIGDMTFEFRVIGLPSGPIKATVLSTPDGSVSGEFSSVVKTPSRAESAKVMYGSSQVEVIYLKGMVITFN